MGPARRVLLALHLLHDRVGGLRHDLLQDGSERQLRRLELAGEGGEDAEIAFFGTGAQRGEAGLHGSDESLVRVADLPVEVLLEQGRIHRPSIGRPHGAINAIVAVMVAFVLLAPGARAIDVPGTDGRVRVGGWLDGRAIVDTGGGERQRPQARLDLEVTARPTRRLRFVGEVRTRVGGPFEGGSGVGVYDLSRTFQNVSPAFDFVQGYGEIRSRRAELRVGIQTFAWGKLDGLPPTDVLNPRDYHDPLVDDAEERKIGVPAITTTYYPSVPSSWALSGLRGTLVWVPFAVPSRLGLLEERWFPNSTEPPTRVPASLLRAAGLPGNTRVPITFATRNDSPPRTFDHGAIGLRLAGTWHTLDWSLYHYSGQETGPNASLVADLFLQPDGSPAVDARLKQASDTMHMTGADVAYVFGPVAVRAEFAHFLDRPYLRRSEDLIGGDALAGIDLQGLLGRLAAGKRVGVPLDNLFPDQDAIEWGVGADLVWHGYRPLVQLSQVVILDGAPPLLIADPETRLVTRLEKGWLDDRLGTEVQFFLAMERGSWFIRPEVSYLLRDDLRIGVGYLAVGGPASSLIGQFKRNDEVLFLARWTF